MLSSIGWRQEINKETSWYLYIIETQQGTLYTGITNDLPKRWQAHLDGKGAKYLRAHPPKAIVYLEKHTNRSEASVKEAQIKALGREKKQDLIVENKMDTQCLLADINID